MEQNINPNELNTLKVMVFIQKMPEADFIKLLGFIQNEITVRSIRRYAEKDAIPQ